MQWPPSFYEMLQGNGCPLCKEGRPDETKGGVRFFEGEVCDAYLRRTDIQRGLTIAVWRGRHVAEPTELTEDEWMLYWREILLVGRALIEVMKPVKLNYNLLGNSVPHLHTHIVPRYKDDPKPGWPLPFLEVEPPNMPDDVLRSDIASLREWITHTK